MTRMAAVESEQRDLIEHCESQAREEGLELARVLKEERRQQSLAVRCESQVRKGKDHLLEVVEHENELYASAQRWKYLFKAEEYRSDRVCEGEERYKEELSECDQRIRQEHGVVSHVAAIRNGTANPS